VDDVLGKPELLMDEPLQLSAPITIRASSSRASAVSHPHLDARRCGLLEESGRSPPLRRTRRSVGAARRENRWR
jgi:hypothetical protein